MARNEKRKDKDRKVLRKGESQRKDGYYIYRWTSRNSERHCITAKTLTELRQKEEAILKDKSEGIRVDIQNVRVNDVYDLWCGMKRGLKDNTFQNYKYMYKMFVEPDFGKLRIATLKKSDVKHFYNLLAEERYLKVSTIDSIHTVLHQVLAVAVDDGYLRTNPADNILKELKQSHNFDTERRKALTVEEQELFLDFLKKNHMYHHWYPIFAVMVGTGMRVGEVIGLRWQDIDLEEGMIDVSHTLIYYNHEVDGCYFNIHTPKTQHQRTLNKALRRIIRDCNDEQLEKSTNPHVLLPRFSCHSLRHSFTTRLVEQNVNLKVIQDCLGHKDVKTTLEIYTDVTNQFCKKEFNELDKKMNFTVQGSVQTETDHTE